MKGIEMVTGRLGEDMKLETKKPLTPRTSRTEIFRNMTAVSWLIMK